MKKINHSGFAVLEIVLILVIVGIVGGAGWYVYQAKNKTNKTLESTANSQADPQKAAKKTATAASKDETTDWLSYTPADKTYTVRIPDGWQLLALNGNIYGKSTTDIVFKSGTKATVTDTEGGWDGAVPFSLINPGSYADQIVHEGTKQGTITTASGLTADKYVYTQETEPEGIGYRKDDKVYTYYFGSNAKYLEVQHVVNSGYSDQSATVEKLIKTLTVN